MTQNSDFNEERKVYESILRSNSSTIVLEQSLITERIKKYFFKNPNSLEQIGTKSFNN